jgi:hypothetical protein
MISVDSLGIDGDLGLGFLTKSSSLPDPYPVGFAFLGWKA